MRRLLILSVSTGLNKISGSVQAVQILEVAEGEKEGKITRRQGRLPILASEMLIQRSGRLAERPLPGKKAIAEKDCAGHGSDHGDPQCPTGQDNIAVLD
jgi:hypothetical protein